jgi:poly-gamma-glutamate capsule biosynthesis protein CapA/YwtB (metallophosphatase superfamily)
MMDDGHAPLVSRRAFLSCALMSTASLLTAASRAQQPGDGATAPGPVPARHADPERLGLFLCGDVMSGRAIDQILPHAVDPCLYEPYITDAREYVDLAETVNGAIPRPVDYRYPWGDALAVLDDLDPAVRIVNLETAVTTSATPWPDKGIHYRMHPGNVELLQAARIDCCVLANNHVLDWHYRGLAQTLDTLHAASIASSGAGRGADRAAAPAIIPTRAVQRVLIFAFATPDSGTPRAWAAADERPGVNLLADYSARTVAEVVAVVERYRQPGDVIVVSIHWGGNWGYAVPTAQRRFAHALIDRGVVDILHGHSSHHPRGIEVYRGRLILYGCGDFINDYEGIRGHEVFRGDLSLMYLPSIRPGDGHLLGLTLVPLQIRRFRLHRASPEDAEWLAEMLNREGRVFGTRVDIDASGSLQLRWH